jgi:hypothetical protein
LSLLKKIIQNVNKERKTGQKKLKDKITFGITNIFFIPDPIGGFPVGSGMLPVIN